LLNRARISAIRVFAMADNLLTLTGYKGINPDLALPRDDAGRPLYQQFGIDNANNRYPISRLVSLGVNAEF
jgi:hypothetical protein